jgi:hypothetical protein
LPAGKEHSGNVTGMEDSYGELPHPQRQELTDQGDSENIIAGRALPHAELGRWLNVIARMKYITPFVLCGFLFGCERGGPTTPQSRLTSGVDKLANAKTAEARFYALGHAAKESFVVGNTNDASKYAQELMTLLPKFPGNWNYGNAVQDSNLVLGRIAVKEGRIEDAKQYLLAAGNSPGSPQMDSFGPNVSLAKDLLEKGERAVVIEYFELCRKFWRMHPEQLDHWSQEVKAGKIPEFGPNLLY